jgi:hypothetical protein
VLHGQPERLRSSEAQGAHPGDLIPLAPWQKVEGTAPVRGPLREATPVHPTHTAIGRAGEQPGDSIERRRLPAVLGAWCSESSCQSQVNSVTPLLTS